MNVGWPHPRPEGAPADGAPAIARLQPHPSAGQSEQLATQLFSHLLEEVWLLGRGLALDPTMLVILANVAVATHERDNRPGKVTISRRSIALATGLPRETVRRRVARLVEIGLLGEQGSGVVARIDWRQPQNQALLESLLARHAGRSNALLAAGFLAA